MSAIDWKRVVPLLVDEEPEPDVLSRPLLAGDPDPLLWVVYGIPGEPPVRVDRAATEAADADAEEVHRRALKNLVRRPNRAPWRPHALPEGPFGLGGEALVRRGDALTASDALSPRVMAEAAEYFGAGPLLVSFPSASMVLVAPLDELDVFAERVLQLGLAAGKRGDLLDDSIYTWSEGAFRPFHDGEDEDEDQGDQQPWYRSPAFLVEDEDGALALQITLTCEEERHLLPALAYELDAFSGRFGELDFSGRVVFSLDASTVAPTDSLRAAVETFVTRGNGVARSAGLRSADGNPITIVARWVECPVSFVQ